MMCNRNEIVVFKVVDTKDGGFRSVSYEMLYGCGRHYRLGEKTTWDYGSAGPLFAFDTLEHADQFRQELYPHCTFAILRCKAEKSLVEVTHVSHPSYATGFWDSTIEERQKHLKLYRVPEGTVICHSITPLEVVTL